MPDRPDSAQLAGDAQEVWISLERLEKLALAAAEQASREPASPWSGRPRAAAGFRAVAAAARRCAILATSVGLRDPDSDGWTWIKLATDMRRVADSQERLARSMAGRGWRRPIAAGALWAILPALLLAVLTFLLGAW